MSINVLVTGGTGYIGLKLLKKLSESQNKDKYNVTALVRKTSNTSGIPDNVKTVVGDIGDIESLRACTNGIHTIIHLAAFMDFYPPNVDEIFAMNVKGTKNILKAANSNNVERFIYCSSTEAIGGQPTEYVLENVTPKPNFDYGESKRQAEELIRLTAASTGMGYMILRPCGVTGPDDDFAIPELMSLIDFGLFFFVPNGAQKHHLMFVHVDDVVQGFVKALESDDKALGKTYNITPNDSMTYEAWIQYLCKKQRRIQPLFYLPMALVKFVVTIAGPIFNIGRKKLFMMKAKTLDRMCEHRSFSNKQAALHLGFSPAYTIKQTIDSTLSDLRKRKKLWDTPISPLAFILGLLVFATVYFYF